MRLRELRQADAEIDVGDGIIGVPPAFLTVVAREDDAAEIETTAEGIPRGELRRSEATVAAAPDLSVAHRDAGGQHADRTCHGPPQMAPGHLGHRSTITATRSLRA